MSGSTGQIEALAKQNRMDANRRLLQALVALQDHKPLDAAEHAMKAAGLLSASVAYGQAAAVKKDADDEEPKP